nr:restriction endonuclease subunit S [Candidatus Liberibacter asiaticus]
MKHYKAYPQYKDSGVQWIGAIPKHWKVVPIKRFTKLNTGRTSESGKDIIYIGLEDVESGTGKYLPKDGNSRQSDTSTVSIFAKGQILYGKLGPYLRKAIIADFDGICSTQFLVLQPKDVLPELLQGWLLSIDVTQRIEAICEGATMSHADWKGIGNIPMPIPPLAEQVLIREKIIAETVRIDTLITERIRFIELLKEKKQALVSYIVTKGLNTDVKMKDSGIEWVGLVPDHWEVKPFFALVTELNRKNTKLIESNILSLSYGNIIQKLETRNMGLKPESYETYQIVDPGEIVFRFIDLQNDKRSLRSAQVMERGIITSAYMAVKPHGIDSTYLAWLMRSYDLCKVFYAMGSGLRQSLKFEDVKRLPVLVPPIKEQFDITNVINVETARIDVLVEKIEQSIVLLKERRSSFIAAAVTGQIDLRGESQ